MFEVQEIDDVMLSFPASVSHLMPKQEDIPEVYKDVRGTIWNKLFNDWFFCGVTDLQLTPCKGVDKEKALHHIRAIMGSFEPKHEHKERAVAFLFGEWFESPKWKRVERDI